MKARANGMGVDISPEEIGVMVKNMPVDVYGRVTPRMYDQWIRSVSRPKLEKEAMIKYIGSADEKKFSNQILAQTGNFGCLLYVMMGTLVAGESGLNVVGSVFVGCISGLGGGTLNDMMMGKVPVFWMKQTGLLTACILTSMLTFYGWPVIEEVIAENEIQKISPGTPGYVSFEGFSDWLRGESWLTQKVREEAAKGLKIPNPTPRQIFNHFDYSGDGAWTMNPRSPLQP